MTSSPLPADAFKGYREPMRSVMQRFGITV